MKKKKTIIFRIICLLMLCIFPALALLSGCGDENAELDDSEKSDPETITSSSLFGTKVLYRPDDYNYDEGSGGSDGSGSGTNDYYGQYAWHIINFLYNIYEIANTNTGEDIYNNIQTNNPNFPEENIPYLYDSMRYQVNTVGTVTSRQVVNPNNITVTLPNFQQYQIVGADTSVAWNWGAPYDMKLSNTGDNTINTNAYLTYENGMSSNVGSLTNVIMNNIIYAPYDLSGNYVFTNGVNSYYIDIAFTQNLMNYYLGTENAYETEEQEYSDFVKALEYAIYCYAVDLEPAEVRVTFASDGTPNVQVTGYDSVDSALERAKENFQILGSFVGLADRQIEKIEAWVLDNIIGEDVVDNADYFYGYKNVTEVVTVDENGEYSYSYDFKSADSREIELGRDYEGTVANIIQNVCSEVSIGNDDGSDVTIDQRFPASEVMEYAGVANNVSSDSNFAVPGQENSADKIRPYEYQSIVFMVKEEVSVDGVGIALKYDSGLDGTTKGVYGEEYLDIIVDLNYYNNATDTLTVLESMQVRVYDGPWDQENVYYDWPDEKNDGKALDAEETTGAPKDHYSGIYFGDVDIELGAFKTDIGDGVLMTDVGKNGYSASLLISEKPLVLVGTTDVRKYYEIVEPGSSELDNEQIPDNYTYLSGRFNSDMFSGAEGCDYLEVTFKVLKRVGDTTPNRYKFYAGALDGGLTDTGPDHD